MKKALITALAFIAFLGLMAFAEIVTAADFDEITFTEAGPIAPGSAISFSSMPDTRLCESLLLAGEFTGDSLVYIIDYTWDKSTFWVHDSATVASGSDIWNRVVLTKAVGGSTYALDRIMWPYVRLRVRNASAIDTLTNITLKLWCGR